MLQVNLLPWRKLRCQRRSRYWLRLFLCLSALVTFCALLLRLTSAQDTRVQQQRLSALNTLSQQLSLQQRRVDTASSQVKALTAERLIRHQRLQRSLDYLQLLGLLAAEIPQDVWLTDFTDYQGGLTLKGGGRFYHDILAFSEVLSTRSTLGDVSLASVQQQPDQVLAFVIKARFHQPASLPEPKGAL